MYIKLFLKLEIKSYLSFIHVNVNQFAFISKNQEAARHGFLLIFGKYEKRVICVYILRSPKFEIQTGTLFYLSLLNMTVGSTLSSKTLNSKVT